MPQYDDSFLLDCEKKRNLRSYKPYKKYAISNCTNDFAKLPQDYGTIGKWRKKYFTLNRNASPSPSLMPVYRSLHSFDDNSTFNCKFYHNSEHSIKLHFFSSFDDYFPLAFKVHCYARMHRLILFFERFLIGFRYININISIVYMCLHIKYCKHGDTIIKPFF